MHTYAGERTAVTLVANQSFRFLLVWEYSRTFAGSYHSSRRASLLRSYGRENQDNKCDVLPLHPPSQFDRRGSEREYERLELLILYSMKYRITATFSSFWHLFGDQKWKTQKHRNELTSSHIITEQLIGIARGATVCIYFFSVYCHQTAQNAQRIEIESDF